jgi:hypothetical protein
MTNKRLILQIDFRSDLPIYTQIVNQVQAQVVSGILQAGRSTANGKSPCRRVARQLQHGGKSLSHFG